jgi:hypothetical protein
MKLEIELVPSTVWYSNVRLLVSKTVWDMIRKESYNIANYKCQICGVSGRLNCHEIWEYDDKKHIHKLRGFIALCDDCHMIKHMGFAGIQASKGLIDMDKLIEHFMKVNNVDEKTFNGHEKDAFEVWHERSKYEWEQDFGEYSKFIKIDKSHRIV